MAPERDDPWGVAAEYLTRPLWNSIPVLGERKHSVWFALLLAVVLAGGAIVASAGAAVPRAGTVFPGKTAQRHSMSLYVNVPRRVEWYVRWRMRCRKKISAEYGVLTRGVLAESLRAFSPARVNRKGEFRDREDWIVGMGSGWHARVTISIRGRFTSKRRAEGRFRLKGSIRDIADDERVLTRCSAGPVGWRARIARN